MSTFYALALPRRFNLLDWGWFGTSQQSSWQREQVISAGDVRAWHMMTAEFPKRPAVGAGMSPCVS